MGLMRRIVAAVVLAGAVALAGCGAKKPPRAAPPPPPVPAPAPPPLLAAHPLALAVVGWPPALEPVAVAALVTGPPAVRPARPAVEPERHESPPALPPAVPSSLLLPAMDEQVATREIREKIAVAREALRALRYDRLSPDGRAQYETVGQLIEQAEEALKARNFVYALKVADKAATLARRLGGDEEVWVPDGDPSK